MKRLIAPGALAAILISLLALCTFASAATEPTAFAKKTPSVTPTRTARAQQAGKGEPTATRTRRPTRTVTPSPTVYGTVAAPIPTAAPSDTDVPVDNSEIIDAAEISPVSPGPMTSQVVIFNPDATGVATVLLNILNMDGARVFTDTKTINPRGARLISLPSLGSNFQGGAVVSSDKKIQAMVVDANSGQTARDAYEGTGAPSSTLTLPFVRHLGENQNSVAAIQNTSNATGHVTFTYFDPSGTPIDGRDLTLAPLASGYVNTANFFADSQFIGSARITSDQSIAVAEESLYYEDTAAFRGLTSSDEGTILYLPFVQRQLNNKGVAGAWSETFVRNNGGAPTDMTIEYYSSAGAPLASLTATQVQPNGLAQFSSKDAALAALGSNYGGWAKISSGGQPIAVSAVNAQNRGRRLVGISAIVDGKTAKKLVCGDAYRSSNQNSNLYILNTHPSINAKVKIHLYDPNSGAQLAVVPLTVPPNSVVTSSLGGSGYSGAGSSYQGMVMVTASGSKAASKVAAMVYTPYINNGKVTSATSYTCNRLN